MGLHALGIHAFCQTIPTVKLLFYCLKYPVTAKINGLAVMGGEKTKTYCLTLALKFLQQFMDGDKIAEGL